MFGLLAGSIYVSIGATLGATCAFLVGRYLARGWVAGKLEGNPKFKAIDRAVAREGWKIVGLARLSPFFPFNLLNYAFGLTEISLRDYFFATWAGMIPGIIMYVYIGSLAGDVARIGTRPVRRTPAQWTLEVVGFIASVAVAVVRHLRRRQGLARKDRHLKEVMGDRAGDRAIHRSRGHSQSGACSPTFIRRAG